MFRALLTPTPRQHDAKNDRGRTQEHQREQIESHPCLFALPGEKRSIRRPGVALSRDCLLPGIDSFGKHAGYVVVPKRGDLADHRLREPLTHASTV